MQKHPLLRVFSTLVVLTLLAQMAPVRTIAAESEPLQAETITNVPQTTEEETAVVEEITERRTEYTKQFRLNNGLFMAVVYPEAVHYEENGQWQDIDNTLKLSGSAYTNTAGSWSVSLPQQLSKDQAVSVSNDGHTLRFRMAGELLSGSELSTTAIGSTEQTFEVQEARTSSGQVQQIDLSRAKEDAEHPETVPEKLQSRLQYSDVYPGTDIIYDLSSKYLKESVVIESYNEALRGYRYILETGDMTPVLTDTGKIELYTQDSTDPVMIMPSPYLVDDNMEFCYGVEVGLTGRDGTYVLTYTLPTEWLASEDRQWPVILDPIVSVESTYSNIDDTTVYERNAVADNSRGVLECGVSSSFGISRAFLQYNDLPDLTSSDVVVGASLRLYKASTSQGATIVEIHKVNASWQSAGLSWSNQPSYSEVVEDFLNVREQGYYHWDITDIVQGWYANGNTGLAITVPPAEEQNTSYEIRKQFYSADYSVYQIDEKPAVTIVFRNNNGLENYWDYTSASAGRAGTGYVNTYTGNLVWTHSDIGFGGNRMPVSISHVYNLNDVITPSDSNNANDSAGNAFGMGTGWRTNFNQLLYRWQIDGTAKDYYVWEDADGTDHYFTADSSGVLRDEDGLELTLTTGGSGTETYCISDKYGNTTYFDSLGRLTKISNNQATISSITVSYTDSSGKLISTVTDGAGRVYSFSYSGGLLSRISYTGTGTTVISYVDFAYSGTQLTRITDKDGKYSSFAYNSSNLLTAAQDIDGYKLAYSYNTVSESWQPYRVLSVCEYDGSIVGGQLSFSYGHNQTTITDHNGSKQILQFNDFGNRTSVQDDEGRARFAQYAFNTDEEAESSTSTTAKGNQLSASSRLQNTVGSMIANGSFETGIDGWGATDSRFATAAQSSSYAYQGTKSLSFTRIAGGNVGGVLTSFTVEANTTYTFSAYVKSSDGPVSLYIEENRVLLKGETLPANSDWTRLEMTYTNTSSSPLYIYPMVLTSVGTGTYYVDCVQFEKAEAASRYNLVENGDFSNTSYWSSSAGRTTADTAAPELSSNVYQLTGNTIGTNRLSQTVYVGGSAGDSFVLAGWAKGDSVPLDSTDTNPREFGMIATFNYTDGTASSTTVRFNPHVGSAVGWQYAAAPIVASKAYSSVTITLAYDYNANTVLFDGIQLYKEKFGSSYTYDANGNVTAVKDVQGQTTRYEYTSNDLTKQILPTGAELTYTYDSYHNVETATTAEGLEYGFTYDTWGNNTSVRVDSISTSATYTADGNRLASTQDVLGNTTTYSYNADTNVLEWVQYPEDTAATRTNYTYDTMYRLASAAATTDTGKAMSVSYSYTDDLLSSVTTPTTTYSFTYGSFSLASSVKVGTRTLASYSYTTDRNFYLSALDYGNSDKVQYAYDDEGRVVSATYEDGDTVSYSYDNTGALATVTDSGSGIKTTYHYDFTDRLMKYVETGSGYSHSVDYAYDSRNNLTDLVETVNGTARTTTYSYDNDNRITSVADNVSSRSYYYDSAGRVWYHNTRHATGMVWYAELSFSASQVDSVQTSSNYYDTYAYYTYDRNGNILSTSITDGNGCQISSISYVYDSANQLVRENNQNEDYTYVWTYDKSGNILSRTKYYYCGNVLDDPLETVNYTYSDSQWGDLLTGYGDRTITSDAIGNTLSDGKRTYTWEHGRQLATLTQDGVTWTNTYNADGLRTKRTDGTNTYEYVYTGGLLQYMEYNDTPVWFTYAPDGTPISMTTGGATYFYITNLQGDVVALLNTDGEPVVYYTYDAWGNILSTTGSLATTIGALNPLRYRGYVYDVETGLYYLQSRYYDPEIGRFINADRFTSTGQGLLGNNMFAYCGNNPINLIDQNGEAGIWYWLMLDHDMGLVHRAVQAHIKATNPSIAVEVMLKNSRRADVVAPSIGAVWEIKHQSTTPHARAISASLQATSYIGQSALFGGEITHLGDANRFNGSFPLELMGDAYVVSYYTPQPGVILYSVKEQQKKNTVPSYVYSVERKTSSTLVAKGVAVSPVYVACGGPVLTGLCSGLVSRSYTNH